MNTGEPSHFGAPMSVSIIPKTNPLIPLNPGRRKPWCSSARSVFRLRVRPSQSRYHFRCFPNYIVSLMFITVPFQIQKTSNKQILSKKSYITPL